MRVGGSDGDDIVVFSTTFTCITSFDNLFVCLPLDVKGTLFCKLPEVNSPAPACNQISPLSLSGLS